MAIDNSNRPKRSTISIDMVDDLQERLSKVRALCVLTAHLDSNLIEDFNDDRVEALSICTDLIYESLQLIKHADRLPVALERYAPDANFVEIPSEPS